MAEAFVAPRLSSDPVAVWDAQAQLGEGTCWSVREQALYWVDILGQRLHRYTPSSGARHSWSFDETISAVAERAERPGLIVALRHGAALFDPRTGALTRLPVAPGEDAKPTNRFNDGKCDGAGRFWAGTMDFACKAPTGSLWCFEAAPPASNEPSVGTWKLVFEAGFAVTNGPTWSLDGRTMYFNDTVRREVNAFNFDPASAALSSRRLWLRFERDDGFPDGMTTDRAGRIWIAHWGASCVTCHEPENGRELLRVALPTRHITNVAFGGPNLSTLYVTSARTDLSEEQLDAEPLAGALFAVETDAVGLPANRFAG